MALPIGFHYSMIAVTAPAAHPGCTIEEEEYKLGNKELDGRGAPPAKNRRITFGKSYGIQFYCDTITKKYAYEVARTNVKKVRWSDVHAEKAAWHSRLARMIANELSREVFGNLNGLACAAHKDATRWIIDSGSGFDLISERSLTKDDRKAVTKAENPCRMATANGVATAEEQLSIHIEGIGSVDAVVLNNSPCNVLSLGKLCMEKGFGFRWTSGQLPKLLLPDGTAKILTINQYVPVLASANDKIDPLDAGEMKMAFVADDYPDIMNSPPWAEGNFPQKHPCGAKTRETTEPEVRDDELDNMDVAKCCAP
jgi:hypothetical protein